MIPYGRQDISSADVEAVVEVLRSDFLTQGSMAPRFKQTLARSVDGKRSFAALWPAPIGWSGLNVSA